MRRAPKWLGDRAAPALMATAAALAVCVASSPLRTIYQRFTVFPNIPADVLGLRVTLVALTNDALMAAFFFLVAVEVKREAARARRSGRSSLLAPVVCAAGGMLAPACLYLLLNASTHTLRGFGVPMATDVTFAAAAMALVVPMRSPARLFLLTLAVADDVGAILVIAIAYPRSVHVPWLAALAALLPILWFTRGMWYPHRSARIVIAVATWVVFEASGVSPAMTGVCFAMFQPDDPKSMRWPTSDSTARATSRPHARMELAVAWGVLPLFALVNSGVPVQTVLSRDTMTSPVFWGVALGFVIGKPIGIVLTGALIRSRHVSRRIRLDLSTANLLGVGAFGGVGFTVALFVNHLAFSGTSLEAIGRVAVLSGSVASAVVGIVVLRAFRVRPATPAAPGMQPSS